MNNLVIKVKNITKNFGKLVAVNSICFEVYKGQVFGLLGPNGSGKTTTLSMILSLIRPTSGFVEIFGSNNLDKNKNRIGATLETSNFHPDFSGEKNLKIVALIKDCDYEQIDMVLKKVNLYEVKNKKFKTYSFGMKQRLSIASVLLGNPDVIILDEPTNGLDPPGIIFIRNLIIELKKDGKTVIIASHLLNEMEKVCTHIAILNKGRIIKYGDIKDFKNHFSSLEDAFVKLT